MWLNCCRCTRQAVSSALVSLFWGAAFLSPSLAGIEVWVACQPWQAAQRPAPQAVPLCLRLLALVALLGDWVAFESTKGRTVPFKKGRLRLPRWRASPFVYFRPSGISLVLTLASWALRDGWSSACLGTELAAKLAEEGRAESGTGTVSARPSFHVAGYNQPTPQAPDARGSLPVLAAALRTIQELLSCGWVPVTKAQVPWD